MFACEVGVNANVERLASIGSGRALRIGDNSGIGIGCEIYGDVTIGSDVLMGPHCLISSKGHRFRDTDKAMRLQGEYSKKIEIGDNTWIGARVIIMPGVRVGGGSVLGAGTVVREDVPDNTIVIGNPAEVVGIRTKKQNSVQRTLKSNDPLL